MFDYFVLLPLVIGFITGVTLAYVEGKERGKREFLLFLQFKYPKVYKMLIEEIYSESNSLERD